MAVQIFGLYIIGFSKVYVGIAMSKNESTEGSFFAYTIVYFDLA